MCMCNECQFHIYTKTIEIHRINKFKNFIQLIFIGSNKFQLYFIVLACYETANKSLIIWYKHIQERLELRGLYLISNRRLNIQRYDETKK